ncbi:hypothetical protein ASZ90_002871 [hydrocarbon metagenome]|uniref:Uncharacterized protein n=1 Tax=hydrocarbon metagenome TaxID=938273 RepID=A0A0W8G2T0_9ZZZZ
MSANSRRVKTYVILAAVIVILLNLMLLFNLPDFLGGLF